MNEARDMPSEQADRAKQSDKDHVSLVTIVKSSWLYATHTHAELIALDTISPVSYGRDQD
jgi:hypothetical protein